MSKAFFLPLFLMNTYWSWLISSMLLFLAIFTSAALNGQDLVFKTSVSIEADKIEIDNLGNLYVVKGSELIKYNSSGELLQRFSNKKFGKIHSVDVSNPLKIILFYKDFSILLFLDNMLSETAAPIFLSGMQLEQVNVVSNSHNNCLWLYDPVNMELLRMDQNMNIVQKTGNLNQQLGFTLHPLYILEYNNWVYFSGSSKGILVFDVYGTYLKSYPVFNAASFQVRDHELYFFDGTLIKVQHLKVPESHEIIIPDQKTINALIDRSNVFVHLKDQIKIYEFAK
jgi:hypothetical protein